jgi:hypothetical protein
MGEHLKSSADVHVRNQFQTKQSPRLSYVSNERRVLSSLTLRARSVAKLHLITPSKHDFENFKELHEIA